MSNNLLKRVITSLFLIGILFIGLFYSQISWKTLVIFFSVLCFYEFYNLIKKVYKNKFFKTLILFAASIYLYYFYFLLIKIRLDFGKELILILLFACISSDIGGYIIGNLVGGPKLTKLSPNKTISGAFGSIIFTVMITIILVLILNKIDSNPINIEYSIETYLWLIFISMFCQAGDLSISYLKRKANVKDTGNILPGHGGILDRVDGILFAIPLGFLTYLFLN